MKRRILVLVAFAAGLLGVIPLAAPGPAQAQTAAEKLYADLAKLPAEARAKRILDGAKKEGRFAYIQTITGKTGKRHGDLFAKRYSFLKVGQSQMDSQDGSERMIVEETLGRHLTDAISNGVPDLGQIAKSDLAAVYKTPMTDRILPQYKSMLDSKNRYTPWYWSEHGIVYNNKLLKGDQAPHSWMDLCKPHLKGRVSYDTPEVRFLVGLYFMFDKDEKKLENWIKCVAANKPVIQNGHSARMTLMLAGDHAASGDQYLYYGESLRRKSPSKNPYAAAFDAPILSYAAAVTINKNTPHPYASALFTDWTLSEESQKYMAGLLRGPLAIPHPYIPTSAQLVSFSYVDPALSNHLVEMWIKYVGKPPPRKKKKKKK